MLDTVWSGKEGWTAAAMLAATLAWLFFKHIPAVFKQLKDNQAQFTSTLDTMRQTFEHSIQDIVKHCVDEMRLLRK